MHFWMTNTPVDMFKLHLAAILELADPTTSG